ncbi:MAG: PocR ligand-binding domain-containing protein [Treponema sp.]|jgi:ligand-binding sensor protein|nr:PocR ligand-binding domain-containing protein [Treponema sp.]
MNTLDIFLDEKAKSLINSFSYCFKVPITIFSADFKDELVTGSYSVSGYCRLIWEHLHYKSHCRDLDLRRRSSNNAAPQFYVCHAGMVDVVVPIKLGDIEKSGGGGGYMP